MKESEDPSDEDLLQRSQKGDEAAFTILYRRRQGGLFRFALRMSGSPAVAEDVVQEVFTTLVDAPERFDPKAGTLVMFLYGIARNHVRKQLERRRRHVALEESERRRSQADPETQPETDIARLESVSAVREAVLALPETYREVIVLVELQELTYAEAAEVLDCAVGTVRSRLHRGRRLLLEKLGGTEDVAGAPRRGAEGRYA